MADQTRQAVVAVTVADGFRTRIYTNGSSEHPSPAAAGRTIAADAPAESGGFGEAPTPTELFYASLAACKSMTAQMYAQRKGWPLREAVVRVHEERQRSENGPNGKAHPHLIAEVELRGDLSEDQRARVMAIVEGCHVQKTIEAAPRIVSREITATGPA